MERVRIPFPRGHGDTALEPLERELIEVRAAVAMVAGGGARRIRLANLSRPDAAAAEAAAVASGTTVRTRLEGWPGRGTTVCIESADIDDQKPAGRSSQTR